MAWYGMEFTSNFNQYLLGAIDLSYNGNYEYRVVDKES